MALGLRRVGHQGALEERLRRHIWQVRQRRTLFGGPAPLGEIRKAPEDLEIVSGGGSASNWVVLVKTGGSSPRLSELMLSKIVGGGA